MLGRRSGISKSTIGRIEHAEVRASRGALKAIAFALGMPFAELVRPAGPRARMRIKQPPTEELPFAVGVLLIQVGAVTRDELQMLIRNCSDPEFNEDVGLLELNLLFRRACAAMHDRSKKAEFDAAFERLRDELEALT